MSRRKFLSTAGLLAAASAPSIVTAQAAPGWRLTSGLPRSPTTLFEQPEAGVNKNLKPSTTSINTVTETVANGATVNANTSDISAFSDFYLGGKASDPTARNNGFVLQDGDLYFNTTNRKLRVYSNTDALWRDGYAYADLVSYTPSGKGAVPTNLQAKLREFVSVNDYGAVGDGIADDTTAIQAALNASLQVEFNGNYKISASLTLRSGHSIRSTNKRSKLIRDTDVTPFDMLVGVGVSDVTIDNLWFDGVKKTTVTLAENRYCAIRLWDNGTAIQCERIIISRCRFDKTTSAEFQTEGIRGAILLQRCSEVEVSHCQFHDNRGTCIFWWDSTSINVNDCYCLGEQLPYDPTFRRVGSFTSGRAGGVSVNNCRIKDTGYTSLNVSGVGVSVSDCVIESPAFSGITIAELLPAATNVTITGCSVQNPGLDGISIFEADGVIISGCSFRGVKSATRAGILCFNTATGSGPKNVVISSCAFFDGNASGVRILGAESITISGNHFRNLSTGVFTRNLATGTPCTIFIKGNTFFDQKSFALELNSFATTPQTAYVSENIFVSSNVATLQSHCIISSGANSLIFLGTNSFSSNYDVTEISPKLAAGKALLALSGGKLEQLKIVGGIPLRSEWNQKHVTMGAWDFWVDAAGDLRMKNGAPAFDTDGVVVGART